MRMNFGTVSSTSVVRGMTRSLLRQNREVPTCVADRPVMSVTDSCHTNGGKYRSGADVGHEVLAGGVERAATRSAGVPSKTIRPPSWPAPGPRSKIRSACAMTAWCSMTVTDAAREIRWSVSTRARSTRRRWLAPHAHRPATSHEACAPPLATPPTASR